MWLIVMGKRRHELSLVETWGAYGQRYDVEHYFRFGKQRLLMASYQTSNVEHEENGCGSWHWPTRNFGLPATWPKHCHAPGNGICLKRKARPLCRARTPFDRLCATDAITQQHREQLEALRDQTNPRQLRQEIYALIDLIFSLPGAVPGITEDVFLTLTTHSSPEQGKDDS